MEQPLLSMRGISKRFGATQALKNVALDAYAGQVVALIGENGAGKSTLMKVLSGAHVPDEGTMEISGQPLTPKRPQDSRSAGVAIVYQELNLAPHLSVEDNIMLGIEQQRGGFLRRSEQRRRVREALSLLGHPDLTPDRIVGTLSIGAQQLVEIARALVAEARVVVFDEPTSSLTQQDVQRLFDVIRRLQDQGLAIIYISHFLEEIREVANRYVVLRDGEPAGSGLLTDTSNDAIVSLMVGRSVETLFPHVPHQLGEPILQVKELSGKKLPQRVSLKIRRGEIFGLFGLVGAGRTETLRQLFGLDRAAQGTVQIGNAYPACSPNARIRAGLGFVSEDRKGEGLAQSLSIADNLTLSKLQTYSTAGIMRLGARRAATRDWMQQLNVKAQGPEQTIGNLSGGNQQKVAIARVLHQDAEILLLDEPTRGIDVGTKAEIYRLIGELAAAGKTILFVSSYLPELLAVCDTLGVMSKGRLLETRSVDHWTENEILSVAISS
ncbi:sugar ABC transporter ATP-binding protein [Aureliella helgolandensis]|uniref:Ribose import ATP-binding protein RbsA n=1 Tax=Aureliella helgolandensis TaxID=2527968 RepID=A0A518GHE9_9BACT|nr:sugar ABC transporter ATP-binding protein [Aureliella helgolandensis]QDV28000.1 Ribose import ATP-binding protein RbsA [Aureliella helgolandensis]